MANAKETTTQAHTAGPWTVNELTIEGPEPSYVLAKVYHDDDGRGCAPPELEAEANARLISSAPELLACLKEAYDWHKDDPGVVPEEGETGNALQHWIDAIAKAEGRA